MRNLHLDSVKGLLIIFVVLGHVIGNINTDLVCRAAYDFIYMFHMPLFIFISGMLTRKKDSLKAFATGIGSLLLVLAIFHCIHTAGMLIAGNPFDRKMLMMPAWTLWFILSLVYWRLIIQFCNGLLHKYPTLVMLVCVILSLVCGMLPGGHYFSIQRTFHFLPFFIAGYYVGRGVMPALKLSKLISVIIIAVAAALVGFDILPENARPLIYGANPYDSGSILAKGYLLICSSALSMAIYNLCGENSVLARIGKDSLIYYLYHSIIIALLIVPAVNYIGISSSNLLFCIGYAAITMLFIALIKRFKPVRFLANPLK